MRSTSASFQSTSRGSRSSCVEGGKPGRSKSDREDVSVRTWRPSPIFRMRRRRIVARRSCRTRAKADTSSMATAWCVAFTSNPCSCCSELTLARRETDFIHDETCFPLPAFARRRLRHVSTSRHAACRRAEVRSRTRVRPFHGSGFTSSRVVKAILSATATQRIRLRPARAATSIRSVKPLQLRSLRLWLEQHGIVCQRGVFSCASWVRRLLPTFHRLPDAAGKTTTADRRGESSSASSVVLRRGSICRCTCATTSGSPGAATTQLFLLEHAAGAVFSSALEFPDESLELQRRRHRAEWTQEPRQYLLHELDDPVPQRRGPVCSILYR